MLYQNKDNHEDICIIKNSLKIIGCLDYTETEFANLSLLVDGSQKWDLSVNKTIGKL